MESTPASIASALRPLGYSSEREFLDNLAYHTVRGVDSFHRHRVLLSKRNGLGNDGANQAQRTQTAPAETDRKLAETINQDNRLALTVLGNAIEILNVKYPRVAQTLVELYPLVIPSLVRGHQVSPIHHISYVVRFVAEIMHAENSLESAVMRGAVAALFHDSGNGYCVLRKISSEQVANAEPSEHQALVREGVQFRREHMEHSVRIARAVLSFYRRCRPNNHLTDADVEAILVVIDTHDNSKIPLLDPSDPKRWLLRPEGKEAWLSQLHWEGDALWMLCRDGLAVDLKRERLPDNDANRITQINFNYRLHRDIVDVFRSALVPDEFERYRFKNGGTLYRSPSGYSLAQRLVSEVLDAHLGASLDYHGISIQKPSDRRDEELHRIIAQKFRALSDYQAKMPLAAALGILEAPSALRDLENERDRLRLRISDLGASDQPHIDLKRYFLAIQSACLNISTASKFR